MIRNAWHADTDIVVNCILAPGHKMMRESLDRLIGEFLSRMQQAVEEWLQMLLD